MKLLDQIPLATNISGSLSIEALLIVPLIILLIIGFIYMNIEFVAELINWNNNENTDYDNNLVTDEIRKVDGYLNLGQKILSGLINEKTN